MESNQDVLRIIFEEEARALGMDNVELKFLDPPPIEYYEGVSHWLKWFDYYSTGARKNEDGSFHLQFHPLSCISPKKFRSAARHELYHIFRDGQREKIGIWRQILVSEPTAMLYQYLGLRL